MKIVFLCKRQYMQKDVIDDRYGRLYAWPNELANLGHRVWAGCLSYRQRDSGECLPEGRPTRRSLTWFSYNLGFGAVFGFWIYVRRVRAALRAFRPDVIIGSSDCLHAIMAGYFARIAGCPYVIDLYDNYESFAMARIPGVLPLYRNAIKRANGVSCVSESLSSYIRRRYRQLNVLTLESTINDQDFYPQCALAARRQLGLPTQGRLIGVAGALHRNRGIDLLYRGFLNLAESMPDLYLVLAGPADPECPIPEHPRVRYLGLLPHRQVLDFYNALDLAVVCMRDDAFGRFAFPQKTYEILACRTPILTARVGALAQTLADYPPCLYQAGDEQDLQTKIVAQLQRPCLPDIPIPTWASQAERLSRWLDELSNPAAMN